MSELHPYKSEQTQQGLVCEIFADDQQSAQLADLKLFLLDGPYRDVAPEPHVVQYLPARVWESKGSLYQGSYNRQTGVSTISRISKEDPTSYEKIIFQPITDESTSMRVRWDGSDDMKARQGLLVAGTEWNDQAGGLNLRNSVGTQYWLPNNAVDRLMDDDDTPIPIKLQLAGRAENAAKWRLRALLPELTDRPGRVRRVAAKMIRTARRKNIPFL